MRQNPWTWGGEFVGYREGDRLWTHLGECIGAFTGGEVFDTNGVYLGEIRGENRLIRKLSKVGRTGPRPGSPMSRVGIVKSVNKVGKVMLVGYEDFPFKG
jgi:hypothetical protein